MAGSKVGSWYTARSLVFSAPVAHMVWEGFKAILWIPQGHSAGILFLLLFREGMWNCFPVLVSRTISWNWEGKIMELGLILYQQNKFCHTIYIHHTLLHLVPMATCLSSSQWDEKILFIFPNSNSFSASRGGMCFETYGDSSFSWLILSCFPPYCRFCMWRNTSR